MTETLSMALGHHLISQAVTAALAAAHDLKIAPQSIDPIHNAFAPMIREQRFDICELAIVSAVQAFAYDKPLILLPITLAARYQHKCIVCNATRGAFGPEALAGKRIGVRAYTQTTGAWVRTILQHEYGVQPLDMRWVTQVGAHVAEYDDPPHIEHVGRDESLVEMLESGKIDAAIFGNDLPDLPWVVPVISDAAQAGRAAYIRTGVVPINHILALNAEAVHRRPEVAAKVMSLFSDAKVVSGQQTDPDLFPIGLDAMRPSIEALLRSAYDQKLLPHAVAFDALFAPAQDLLGDLAH